MPLDLSGFRAEPNQWAGLYHAADQMEKRKLREDQLALQRETKRNASATFLQNYLDPKDYLSGTNYDPMINQGIQELQQQGAKLAASGADSATLMMTLGPAVNKLSTYSASAKNINKQIDDQIKLMRESGLTGYDYGTLKQEALNHAFFKDTDKGRTMIDPQDLDPSANYLAKAIEANPEKVTTAAGLDVFAKNSPMQKTLDEQTNYDKFNNMNKSKVHLIGQNWLVPERDKRGTITGLVPKFETGLDGHEPLLHNFTDANGKVTKAPVRLLSEDVFDDMMQRRPDIADYMKGIVKQHINEYTDPSTGQPMSMNSPKAKLIARAIAYDELNRRKAPSIENVDVNNKSSQPVVNLRLQQTSDYLKNESDKAAARKAGSLSVSNPDNLNEYKRNPAQVFGDVFTGKEDLSENEKTRLNGTVYMPDGSKKTIKNRDVIDITSSMPGGGLKSGRGEDEKYKGVYFDPSSRSLIVDEVTGTGDNKTTQSKEIPEANVGQFINKIAEANGIPKTAVRKILDEIGYKNGSFSKSKKAAAAPGAADPNAADFDKHKSWRDSMKTPFGPPAQLNP